MGHVRLGTLPQTKKWRIVVGLLDADGTMLEIAEAAAQAAERDLARMPSDPVFQYVMGLLVRVPLEARLPSYDNFLSGLGMSATEVDSVSALLAGLGRAIDQRAFDAGRGSDAGEIAKSALQESLSVLLRDRLPTLFEPTPAEIRRALASFSSGQGFAVLARNFFARLTYRSLDYFLSRELANHTGAEHRFGSDADRIAFQRDMAQHTYEASRIVEAFSGGWYGKTVWKEGELNDAAIKRFAAYSFKKLRSELGRQRQIA